MDNKRPIASRYFLGPLLAGLFVLGACASSPPPPTQPATVVPLVDTPPSPPPTEGDTASQAASAASEPECQAAEDCTKLREPTAGLTWTCENARCLEQAIAEAPKTEEPAEAAPAEKASKKTKGKGKKK